MNKRENFKELRLWITNVLFPVAGVAGLYLYTHPDKVDAIKNRKNKKNEG